MKCHVEQKSIDILVQRITISLSLTLCYTVYLMIPNLISSSLSIPSSNIYVNFDIFCLQIIPFHYHLDINRVDV